MEDQTLVDRAFQSADQAAPLPEQRAPACSERALPSWLNVTKLRRRAEQASDGEWLSFVREGSNVFDVHLPDRSPVVHWMGFDGIDMPKKQKAANARYIAAAGPRTVLALLDALSGAPVADIRDELNRLGMMAHTAMHQDASDMCSIMADLADRLLELSGGRPVTGAPVAGGAQPAASTEHYDEVKATLQGAHRIMEGLSAIERRVGPIGSHARGYTHKITAALRHLDALYAALRASEAVPDVNSLMAVEYQQWIDWYHQGRDYDSFLKERVHPAPSVSQQVEG